MVVFYNLKEKNCIVLCTILTRLLVCSKCIHFFEREKMIIIRRVVTGTYYS